jgi:hypothetical protein
MKREISNCPISADMEGGAEKLMNPTDLDWKSE